LTYYILFYRHSVFSTYSMAVGWKILEMRQPHVIETAENYSKYKRTIRLLTGV
jgi:hypothetical protein